MDGDRVIYGAAALAAPAVIDAVTAKLSITEDSSKKALAWFKANGVS
jgi:hypothetical protein